MKREMNRRERRAQAAIQRRRAAPMKLPPAREDGRPLYFMVEPEPADVETGKPGGAICFHCDRMGVNHRWRKFGEVVMSDPANPPKGGEVGAIYTVCINHLPDDAVIYNPRNNLCHNKAGDHTWEEGMREDIPDDITNL